MRAALLALLAIGCGKELNPKFCAAHPDDERCLGTVDGPDAAIDADESDMPVAHLPRAIEDMLTSDVDITLDATSLGAIIDTTNGTITPAWPGAVILPDVAQDSGPNVMVIQVGSLDIPVAVDYIDVDGTRPLVIVATRTITLGARINASADLQTPGPGGFESAKGTGAGGMGQHSSTFVDSGGGGGSFAFAGGIGGAAMGGTAGAVYGSAATLEGGSGGGRPSSGICTINGGAGGGAIQLTALVSITISGADTARINVGGSGGEGGGTSCTGNGAGGGGGGSGGMIFLESPLISGDGALGALGGGGGEGTSTGGGIAGAPGTEAGSTSVGVGGASGTGGDGGSGALDGPGTPGGNGELEGNGGGGGGGAGHIFLKTTGPAPASLQINPPATSA